MIDWLIDFNWLINWLINNSWPNNFGWWDLEVIFDSNASFWSSLHWFSWWAMALRYWSMYFTDRYAEIDLVSIHTMVKIIMPQPFFIPQKAWRGLVVKYSLAQNRSFYSNLHHPISSAFNWFIRWYCSERSSQRLIYPRSIYEILSIKKSIALNSN